VASGLTAILLAVLVQTTGKAWLRSKLADALGVDLRTYPKSAVDAAVSDPFSIMQHRSYLWIALGVLTAVVALWGRKGGRTAMVFSLVFGLSLAGLARVEIKDHMQSATQILGVAASVLAFVCFAGFCAPATRRYAATARGTSAR
jgi:hypothetical protein